LFSATELLSSWFLGIFGGGFCPFETVAERTTVRKPLDVLSKAAEWLPRVFCGAAWPTWISLVVLGLERFYGGGSIPVSTLRYRLTCTQSPKNTVTSIPVVIPRRPSGLRTVPSIQLFYFPKVFVARSCCRRDAKAFQTRYGRLSLTAILREAHGG
jgi:hypothetical protein